MLFSCEEIQVFIGHGLQWALAVLLYPAIVLFYVQWYKVQYWLRWSWVTLMYENQVESDLCIMFMGVNQLDAGQAGTVALMY